MATALKMWTRESTFEAKGSPVTLGELGLAGTVKEPLDIFIQYVGSKERTSITQVTDLVSPQAIWDFNTTPRGLSTFATCLMVVIDHVKKQNQRGRLLNRFYDVVLEVTNFPPVLLALKTLYNSGIEHYPDVGSLLLLVADVINCLCQVMVPAWVCGSAETKLEGSRQVIAWLHGLCFAAGVNEDVPEYLHPFQCVKDTTTQENPDASKLVDFDEFMTIEIPESPEPPVTIDGPGAGPSATQKMIVAAQNPYDGLLSRLALLKVHKNYLERYGYYFKAPVPWKEFLERPALQRPDPADFDTLLADANLHAPFRMIDPMKIGQCLSAELPVVTLSAKGFVSKYDQIDIGCGERHFYQWNLLEKRISLSRMDPGQYISQQLESVIRERKKAGSWEVDAWAEWSAKANHGDPDESIVICVDSSGSMASSMSVSWNSAYADGRGGSPTSRLVEVKEFFHQFSTRLSSYGLNTSVGLVTFSCQSSVRVLQPLTMLQLDFRERLANVQPELLTAIFDAINVAKDMLVEQRKRFPRTRCRIILLTDGDDNNSTVDRLELCRELVEHEIVLDSIVIGTEMTRELFKMSRATGGYAFCPPTQAVFFQIFLLETLVDIRTRPDIERIMPEPGCWSLFQPKQADMRDPYSFPPCRPHANQDDYFISLSDAPKFMKKLPPSGDGSRSSTASPHGTDNDDPASTRSETALTASTTTRTPTTASSASGPRILMNEIRAMVDNPHDFIDVYVSQSNIGFWKVVIQGPPDSPYENGNFLLYVDIVPDFPRVPPAVRFITPILHPNISKHGRVCHPIFDREWNSRIHVYEVLQNIYGILMTLEVSPWAPFRLLHTFLTHYRVW